MAKALSATYPYNKNGSTTYFDIVKDGEGIEEDFLLECLIPYVDDYYYDKKQDIILKRVLNMLCSLDILTKITIDNFNGFTVGPAKQYLKL